MKKSPLSIVGSIAKDSATPATLGRSGRNLWASIQNEYAISDAGGLAILSQICAAQDRVDQLAATVAIDGATIVVKGVLREHPALKAELAGRAFICRNLQRLGVNLEAVKPVGRPAGWTP